MKRILTVLLFGLCFAVPVLALAQESTEVPTEETFATATPFETPTAEPTATPTPEPPVDPEPPTPINWNLIIPWIGAAILVICIGGFTVLRTALVQLGRSVPLPAWETGKGITNTLYEQLMKLFGRTPNTVDDFLGGEAGKMLEEYFKEVERLRAEVKVLTAQVAVNSSDIAYSARQAGNPPMGTGSHG